MHVENKPHICSGLKSFIAFFQFCAIFIEEDHCEFCGFDKIMSRTKCNHFGALKQLLFLKFVWRQWIPRVSDLIGRGQNTCWLNKGEPSFIQSLTFILWIINCVPLFALFCVPRWLKLEGNDVLFDVTAFYGTMMMTVLLRCDNFFL